MSSGTGTGSRTGRACKLCRRRKVKCDGLATCGNCQTIGTTCQYAPPRKRGPKTVRYIGIIENDMSIPISPVTDTSDIPDHPSFQPLAIGESQLPMLPSHQSSERPRPETLSEIQLQVATRIYQNLLSGLHTSALPDSTISIPDRCVSLYTRYVFGSVPMCHEASLRATVCRFFAAQPNPADRDTLESPGWEHDFLSDDDECRGIEKIKSLTLLIALCSAVSYAVPESLIPNKHHVAPLFLRAARELLNVYQDYDLENPDSSSLNIRLFLSSAIQTSTGSKGVAFHILCEAAIIAMGMRLYCESSFEGKDPIEAQMLRNAFWQLYVCDKTVLVMGGRPVSVHETLFDSPFTVKITSDNLVTLFEYGPESNGIEIEGRLLEGFHIIRRLWTMAARVIRAIESRRTGRVDELTELHQEAIADLSKAYFEIITLTNSLPNWDQPPASSSPDSHREAETGLNEILQRQRTSYLISLHSIKVFVLNSAIQSNMTEIMGLNSDPLSLAMRQIELGQDFFNVLENIPFLHLQAEGEPCVEKIRRVGSLLLELAHNCNEEIVTTRANQCVQRSIDLLVRLDSKASDSIGGLHGKAPY